MKNKQKRHGISFPRLSAVFQFCSNLEQSRSIKSLETGIIHSAPRGPSRTCVQNRTLDTISWDAEVPIASKPYYSSFALLSRLQRTEYASGFDILLCLISSLSGTASPVTLDWEVAALLFVCMCAVPSVFQDQTNCRGKSWIDTFWRWWVELMFIFLFLCGLLPGETSNDWFVLQGTVLLLATL